MNGPICTGCGHPAHLWNLCLEITEVHAAYGPGGGIHDVFCACQHGPASAGEFEEACHG